VAEVPESQAVNTRNRSFIIGALVDIPSAGAEGVLFAHGSRFGGHALYIKDNRLHYAYNWVGHFEQMVVGDEDVPFGKNLILSANFEKNRGSARGRDRDPVAVPRREEGRARVRSRRIRVNSRLRAKACASGAIVANR